MTDFWEAALTRAARTIAQTAIATIGTAAVMSDVNWKVVVSAAILAGILSLLTSVATGLPEVEDFDELTDEEVEEAEYEQEIDMGDLDEEAK